MSLEYLLLENSNDIDDFASLVFPIEHSVLISLSPVLLVTFIFHEEWSISIILPTCPLAQSLYFAFYGHYPNRLSFVKTSLPLQNNLDSPIITGIYFDCNLLIRLMEVHKVHKKLPDQMMNMIVKELDERSGKRFI